MTSSLVLGAGILANALARAVTLGDATGAKTACPAIPVLEARVVVPVPARQVATRCGVADAMVPDAIIGAWRDAGVVLATDGKQLVLAVRVDRAVDAAPTIRMADLAHRAVRIVQALVARTGVGLALPGRQHAVRIRLAEDAVLVEGAAAGSRTVPIVPAAVAAPVDAEQCGVVAERQPE